MRGTDRKALAYQAIVKAILNGDLPPGEPLSERKLAEQHNLSRTPVREILRDLQRQGLVEHHPGRGAFTRKFTPLDIRDIFEVREALEAAAARLAALRAPLEQTQELLEALQSPDPDLKPLHVHSFIVSASQNRVLQELYEQLELRLFLVRTLSKEAAETDAEDSGSAHSAILQAILQRDPDRAEQLMREHLARVQTSILKRFFGHP